MLRLFSIFILIVVTLPQSVFAKDISIESEIVSATVYTNRAQITRLVSVDIPKGSHTLVFTGLPVGLLPDSLRAKGEAFADVKLGAITHKQIMEADLTAPREKQLNEALQTVQDQKRLIGAEKEALTVQKTFLINLGKNAVLRQNEDIAQVDLKPETWGDAAGTLQIEMSTLLKKDLSYAVQIRELTKEEQRIRREMNQLRTGQRSVYQVSVPFEAELATKLTLNLDYQVSNASWRPLYDARLTTENKELDLILYGAVRQNTGEDWTNVHLTLSTAQPHRGASQPDLGSMWVNLLSHQKYGRGGNNFNTIASNRVSSPLAELSSIQMFDEDKGVESDSLPVARKAVMSQAQIETGGFISEYKITGPSTVIADGSESKVLVGSFETENHLFVEVKPQLSQNAMLVTKTKLLGEAPILAGNVNLFRDGAYVGQMRMPLLRPLEAQNLAFGIDDNISVTRRTLKDERSEEGLIAKDAVLERHFTTEIINLHTTPIDVAVLQNTPVSQNEDIQVMIIKEATSGGYEKDHDKVKGLMRWSTLLPPQGKKDINLGWKVTWPSDQRLSGL